MDEQRYEYRTGDTQPRKNSNGLIALLLICVIFLAGVVSVLSLLNIRLLQDLQDKGNKPPLSFAEGDLTPVAPEGDSLTIGDITLQELPLLYEEYYHLPHGVYVVVAPEDGKVISGDVLIGFGGSAVGSLTQLNTLLVACKPGEKVELTFYRPDNQYYTHTIVIK